MSRPDIVVPVALQHTNQATCTAPWYVCNTEYLPVGATYQPLINGEEAFKAVHEAIAAAQKSIDIICWGFQPSMYFIRKGESPNIGELLKAKARKGIEVRMLGWEMPFNLAGMGGRSQPAGQRIDSYRRSSAAALHRSAVHRRPRVVYPLCGRRQPGGATGREPPASVRQPRLQLGGARRNLPLGEI
ncbi:phosphatidylserine/phosphatidylglycerophosphate/cardiolipin synthase-like enzyme [Pseudomonas baetica]|nr:phosphatidylserine/phosphatidylglycerophosphate/cardiolipin synthase-like enzyme [Pseudomonas baetica]